MLIKQLTGQIANADTVLDADPNRIEATFEADAAIVVGVPIQLDKTANTDAKLVLTCLAAEDELLCGVYEGQGGTGADTTVTGLKGKDAADGDIILATVLGRAYAKIQDTTTAVAAGNSLAVLGDGLFRKNETAFAAGLIAPVVALEARAATTNTFVHPVFVRLM